MKELPLPVSGEYDVVIIGSGVAGLTAALAAATAGLQAVVLEKTALVGGASSWSYGELWFGDNEVAAAAGMQDDRESVLTYLDYIGGGENTPARTVALVDGAAGALRFFREAGIPLALVPGVNDVLYGKAPGTRAEGRTFEPVPIAGSRLGLWRSRLRTPPGNEWRVPKSVVARLPDPAAVAALLENAIATDQIAQGAGLVAHLLCAVLARDVPVVTDCTVARLATDNGVVTAAVAQDGRVFAARRGVALATGNYLYDEARTAQFDMLTGYRSWYPETNTGDGIPLAGALGAAVGFTRNNVAIMLGYEDPTDPSNANVGAPSVRELPRAHTMVVNRAGRRFGNEVVFQELAVGLRVFDVRTRKPANLPCWMVFDQHYAETWGLAGSAPGSVPDWVPRADTLAALGALAGIDPEVLQATATRLNAFAQDGVDQDFGRKPGWSMTPGSGTGKNPSLGTIDKPPFYAVRLFPTLGVAGGGLRADASARVLDWRGAPIAGLYAAGDVALHDDFGTGYQAGTTFASAITFARIAVTSILAAEPAHLRSSMLIAPQASMGH